MDKLVAWERRQESLSREHEDEVVSGAGDEEREQQAQAQHQSLELQVPEQQAPPPQHQQRRVQQQQVPQQLAQAPPQSALQPALQPEQERKPGQQQEEADEVLSLGRAAAPAGGPCDEETATEASDRSVAASSALWRWFDDGGAVPAVPRSSLSPAVLAEYIAEVASSIRSTKALGQHAVVVWLDVLGALSCSPSERDLRAFVRWLQDSFAIISRGEAELALCGLVSLGYRGDPAGPLEAVEQRLARAASCSPAIFDAWAVLGRPFPPGMREAAEAFVARCCSGRDPNAAVHLTRLLHGLARADEQPSPELVRQVDAVLGDAARVRRVRARDLVRALWAVARLKLEPAPRTVLCLAAAVVEAPLEWLSAAELASALWALAYLEPCARAPARTVWRLADALLDQPDACAPDDLLDGLWALAQLRSYRPSPDRLDAADKALLAGIAQLRPERAVHLLWIWAAMAHDPLSELEDAVEGTVAHGADHIEGRDAVAALYGAASRKRRPSDACLNSLRAAVRRESSLLDDDDNHQLEWATAALGLKL
jgi:hypothetical protein